MSYCLNGDPDECACAYHEAARGMELALFRRPGQSLVDVPQWEWLRRMARKMGHVAWARLCGLPVWSRKIIPIWQGLQGACPVGACRG